MSQFFHVERFGYLFIFNRLNIDSHQFQSSCRYAARRTGRLQAFVCLRVGLTSEQIPAATMIQRSMVNRVVPNSELEQSARQLALRAAGGATRAYAADKGC
jgi:enoyl-CoA hydratase/carnithine racemase